MRKWIQSLPTVSWTAAALFPPREEKVGGEAVATQCQGEPPALGCLSPPCAHGALHDLTAGNWWAWEQSQTWSPEQPERSLGLATKGQGKCVLMREGGSTMGWRCSLVVGCEEFGWPARCPPLLNQEVWSVTPVSLTLSPLPGNPHQHPSVAKHTSGRGWHISPGREGGWGKRGRQQHSAMALVTVTGGLCHWVKSLSPESSSVLTACPTHSRAGVGTVSQESWPGFCTILLGHYHLDKLCVLWSGQDNPDRVSTDCNSTRCSQGVRIISSFACIIINFGFNYVLILLGSCF